MKRTMIRVNEDKIDKLMAEEQMTYNDAERICGLPKNWRPNMRRNGTATEDTIKKLAMLLRVAPDELIAKDDANEAVPAADVKRLSEKLDLLHGENLEIKQKLESMPEMIASTLARYLSAEAWLFSKLKHNRDGISEVQLNQLAQNNGISAEELKIAMDTIGADRYKRNGNTWLSLYRTV